MTSLKKTGVITSLGAAFLVVVLYQNCGKGFVAHQDLMEEISASSTLDPDSATDPDEAPPRQPPVVMDPPDTGSPSIPPVTQPTIPPPPIGTTNPSGAPEITMGLVDRFVLGSADGILAEIKVQDPSSVKTYEWIINGQKNIQLTPKFAVRDVGIVDVSVVVNGKNGKSSSSRALFSISRFAVINGKLNYTLSTRYQYVEIPDADVSSLKLIGLNTVADASKVYSATSALKVLQAVNPTTVKELSSNYLTIDDAVYYKGVVIPTAKASSFSVLLDTGYGKDNAKVFCKTAEVVGADAPSFDVPFKGIINFARDKENFFSECKKLKSYDSSTFSVVESPLIDPKDWKGLYLLAGKLYFITGSSVSQGRKLEMLEVPFVPQAGAQLKIVGEIRSEVTSSDTAPYADWRRLVTDGSQFAVFKYMPSSSTNQFQLLKSSVQVDLPSFALLEKPLYVDKDRVYVLDQEKGSLEALPQVHASTFKSMGSGFYKSETDIYSVSPDGSWKQISGVDVATFALIGDGFCKDKDKVYFLQPGNAAVVAGANPSMFTRVNPGLYKDSSQVWYVNLGSYLPIPGADPATLKFVSDSAFKIVFYDQSKLYLAMADLTTRTLQSTSVAVTNTAELKLFAISYIYTSRALYYLAEKEIKLVPGVTPGVLKSYGSCIGSDHTMICQGEILAGIVADELIPVAAKNGSADYYKNSTSVYHYNSFSKPLANAQLSTFRLADPNLSSYYATDGVRVWAGGTLLTMADVATFKVLGLLSAEDKNYRYSIAFPSPKDASPIVVQPVPPKPAPPN